MPRFHMNLISTILLRERGEIYLDEYTMQLQRKPNRKCYAQLHTRYRMTVAEFNTVQCHIGNWIKFLTNAAGGEDIYAYERAPKGNR
jgi:hypothetical protein